MTDFERTVEVPCPVTISDSGDHHGLGLRTCHGNVLVEVAWEPADPNFGADADGNRGMYVPGFWAVATIPDKCDVCGFEFTVAGKETIEREAQKIADELPPADEEDDRLDEPEYDEEDYIEDMRDG